MHHLFFKHYPVVSGTGQSLQMTQTTKTYLSSIYLKIVTVEGKEGQKKRGVFVKEED